MADNQDRFYNIHKLHFIFAIVSLTLLAALILLFINDYSREWKDYQKKFRSLDIERSKAALVSEKDKLLANDDYNELLKKVESAQSILKTKTKERQILEHDLNKLQSKDDIAQRDYQFAKAKYDALKYTYEKSLAEHSSESTTLKKELDSVHKRLNELTALSDKTRSAVSGQLKLIQDLQSDARQLEKEKSSLSKQITILEKKLSRIDPKSMSIANKLAESIRNLPILDMLNPSYKIDQIVLKDITDDVNFVRVPKVDRCTTCHVGILKPGFEDAPQPFRTHPNLDLYLSSKSPHPMEEFGCTVCHNGRGRGTDFYSAAHMPSNPKQKTEWERKYRWKLYDLTETPMYPIKYTQAGCFKCHDGQEVLKGAEKLNLGLNLIEKSGCYGCHYIPKYKDWPRVGPNLTNISAKLTKDWAFRWIWDPKSFRHNTWMPAFFNQSNTSDPDSIKRNQQEVHAMVHYLFEAKSDFQNESPGASADVKKGEELVASLGCFGCHDLQPKKPLERVVDRNILRREHGPNLNGMGSKTSRKWIYTWLKDPSRYHPGTRMPNLRLSDEEASHVAAYLSDQKNFDFMKNEFPAIDEKIITKIASDFLAKMTNPEDAAKQLANMSTEAKLKFAGQKLIKHYGCFACHIIPGFENEKPIGTELTEEGNKNPHKLDFGFVHLEHTNYAWFEQKLKDPRIFDQDRIRTADEKLKMPNFNFSPQEIEAITTTLLGFVKDKPAPAKLMPRTPKNLAIEVGQRVVREFNCQGCHVMEGEGGDIQPTITDWLIKFDNKSEDAAKSMTLSFSPPNLKGEGEKVQTQWLNHFFADPQTIRPWLKVRMPTFGFKSKDANTILEYFSELDDQEFPFTDIVLPHMSDEEIDSAKKLFGPNYFDCGKCHIVGKQLPQGTPDSWAPDFAMAKTRLKPEWIIKWIKNPPELMPGTKMPAFFDPKYFESSGPDDILEGDENAQIKVLRDYILTISDHPPVVVEQKPATPVESAAKPEQVSDAMPSTQQGDAPVNTAVP